METLIALVTLDIIALLYILPYIVAKYRNHHNLQALAAFNLFLGWTFIGWALAFTWALMKKPLEQTSNSL